MWIKVLKSKPLEGTMAEVRVANQEFFVTLVEGRLFCARNSCPHEAVKLSLGCIKGTQVRCSLHGFSFDLKTGFCSDTDIDNLKLYPVQEKADGIYIKV